MFSNLNLSQMKKIFSAAVAVYFSTLVHAQVAGSSMLRIGALAVSPHVNSSDLSAPSFSNSKFDISSDTRIFGGFTWMWTDNVAVDFPLAATFKQSITGAGSMTGIGKVAAINYLPISTFVQYRFNSPLAFERPYVGIGLTYAKFSSLQSNAVLTNITGGSINKPTSFSMESKLTPSIQLGIMQWYTESFGLDLNMAYTPMATRISFSTGQNVSLKINPISFSAALTHKF